MSRPTRLPAPRSIRPETRWEQPARGFALCFAALAAAGIVAAVIVYRADVQSRLRNLAQREETQVTLVSAAVARDLAVAAGSLLVVARSNELRDVLASGGPATREALANTLVSHASLTRLFDQVRYIDDSGREVVRVSYDGGRAAVAPRGLLVDQSQREYVAQTLRLPAGEFYLSPLDLALRGDGGERTPKAVIRLATPVFDPQGRRRGLVVLDYLARRLVENVVRPAPAAGSMMLLNRDGNWVSGSDTDAASTFREPADRSFADQFPEAWGRIASGASGQFETTEGLFTFDTVSPLRDLSALAGGIGAGATAGAPSGGAALKVVAYAPPSVLSEQRQLARARLGTLLPPALFIAALLAGLLARYVMRYRDTLAALRSARVAATAASRAKSAFLALMNREIRAPIQGVLGMTDLALTSDGPQQREYLQTARSSAASLLAAVDSMLEFSRIEAGSVTIQAIPFSLRETIGEVTRVLAVHARTSGLTLGCEIAPDLPDALIGDPGRLRQVIGILAENAIKFTARGEVQIGVARFVPRVARAKRTPRVERSDVPIGLQFTVRDTGIGIAPDKLEAVFGAFTQGGDANGRDGAGTGLGLPIARHLTEMMGGTMWADSVPGKGSTFTFTARFGRGVEVPVATSVDPPVAMAAAPIAAPVMQPAGAPVGAAPEQSVSVSPEPRRLHVLLAEDDAVDQALVRRILESRGHTVVAVADGHSVLAELELAREPFDVVLMDVDMPHLDGLAAVRAIRRREAERTTECSARLPVIAMSAGASEEDDERSASAGADRRIAKPIEVDALCAALAALVPELPPIPVLPPAGVAPSTAVQAGR